MLSPVLTQKLHWLSNVLIQELHMLTNVLTQELHWFIHVLTQELQWLSNALEKDYTGLEVMYCTKITLVKSYIRQELHFLIVNFC